MSGASISSHWRPVLFGMLFAFMLGSVVYVTMRMKVTYSNQAELKLLKDEVEAVRKQGGVRLRIIDERLDSLEASVYGQLEPAMQQSNPDSRWMANRDRELRERLRRLEVWRLKQDQRLKEQ